MTSKLQLPAVGARISHASNLGTVRFVGQVDGTEGIWLGVEWDDPKRGKHSGAKDGKQYFTCKVPNSASFLRPNPSIILGCSFLQALSFKYVETLFDTTIEKVMLGSSNGAIEVEAVGMNKVRSNLSRLDRLREVSLDRENVAWADDPSQLRLRCPDIRGLDLSYNLLSTWEAVAQITEGLPLLETLSLNFNRLQLPTQNDLGMAFALIRELRLNGTLITWEDLQFLLPSFPKLLRLELGLNNLEDLTIWSPLRRETNVTTLNLQENRLRNWQTTVEAVASFRQLDRLIMSENMLESIPMPSSPSSKLPQLKHLILTSNSIRSWPDINALPAWFPNLQTLNINFNPIAEDKSVRPLIIARISTLITLNASTITPAERRDSELFYLSSIAKGTASSEEERERNYPRHLELSSKYGRPAEIPEQLPDTLKNRLVATHFFQLSHAPPEPQVILSTPEFTLRVLPSMSLRVLRLKVLRTLKSPETKIQMWLALERGLLREFVELNMDLANKPLEWWGVDDNSNIVYYIQ